MGRAYAGQLGLLAFALMAVRCAAQNAGPEETLLAACAALFVFAAVGYLIGQLAEHLVSESVRTQFQVAMATWDQNQKETKTPAK